MSAHTADSQYSFKLPTLSYVDARWEEANLHTPQSRAPSRSRVPAWLSHAFTAFSTWRMNREAAAELGSLTDRELLDIGLSRSDVGRAFRPAFNEDLRQRGCR